MDTMLSESSYLTATADGQFLIGCLATYDAGTVKLNKAEMRQLYGALRRLDLDGQLEDLK